MSFANHHLTDLALWFLGANFHPQFIALQVTLRLITTQTSADSAVLFG